MHIRGLWEEKGSTDTRLLEGLTYPDEFAVVGQSESYAGTGRREHVIPRLVIIKRLHAMLCAGASDWEIAAFIRKHVKIVRVTNAEQEAMDRVNRQTMAEGWTFDSAPFARLAAAGITWKPVSTSD